MTVVRLQLLWKRYIEANPTNNMMERKIRREAFFAGADAVLEIGMAVARLTEEAPVIVNLTKREKEKKILEIVGGTDHE